MGFKKLIDLDLLDRFLTGVKALIPFIVNVTQDPNTEEYQANKTYTEIKSAIDNGLTIFARLNLGYGDSVWYALLEDLSFGITFYVISVTDAWGGKDLGCDRLFVSTENEWSMNSDYFTIIGESMEAESGGTDLSLVTTDEKYVWNSKYDASNPPPYPVTSVNGKTGAVSLNASDVGALPSNTSIPSKTSDLTNDSGFLTSYTETDPTVPAWAKASSKPIYTASEVGALPANTSIPSKTSDLTNDSGFITGMMILSYGSSTWQDFLTAYQANKVVYCRASSNSNPATGTQGRLAFMAFISGTTDVPTSVEFQYYRSVSSHSDSQQGDQVYVYKLTNADAWSVTVREAYTKIAVGTGLLKSYSSGTLTLSNSQVIPTKTSDLTNDSGFITGYTETDPTVPAWAKASSKPTYTASEVGLGNVDNVQQYSVSNPPPYPVTSVNGSTGAVNVRELPSVTSSDDGKFLCVDNGTWVAVTVPNANGVSF